MKYAGDLLIHQSKDSVQLKNNLGLKPIPVHVLLDSQSMDIQSIPVKDGSAGVHSLFPLHFSICEARCDALNLSLYRLKKVTLNFSR